MVVVLAAEERRELELLDVAREPAHGAGELGFDISGSVSLARSSSIVRASSSWRTSPS